MIERYQRLKLHLDRNALNKSLLEIELEKRKKYKGF